MLVTVSAQAQVPQLEGIEVHGNVEVYGQTYNTDSLIGAPKVAEKSGLNSFTNLIATSGALSAGLRIESYLPPIQGFDARYGNQPIGVPYRFVRYSTDKLDITAGHLYEQFGNGIILRSYEERALGLDNALDGVRVMLRPIAGLKLKALVGNQRYYWLKSTGYIRGFDAEFNLNDAVASMADDQLRLSIGGSFVSKFQPSTLSELDLPLNVASYGGRAQMIYKGFSLAGEYVYKMNDPSTDNNYIYRPGQALFVTAAYSTKGFAITATARSTDNMSFRSGRDAILNDQLLTYQPALTRQHTYNLAGTLYPYATQLNGEIGLQADVIYKLPKETAIGGKYGTTISLNVAMVNGHKQQRLSSVDSLNQFVYLYSDPQRLGYESDFFSVDPKKVYFRDYNLEIERKISSDWKVKALYAYFEYNIDLIQGKTYGTNVFANVAVADVLHKITKKHSIRGEVQHLWTHQDQGNWAFALLEYGYSPHWFVTVLNQYNYGNKNAVLRLNYPTAQVVYIFGSSRLSVGYGRQRAGIFCVGGVCRPVPAANGLTVSLTSSF